MCPPSDCSRFGRLIAPGQLILERDVLEVFAGVSDPVLRRLAVRRWHGALQRCTCRGSR